MAQVAPQSGAIAHTPRILPIADVPLYVRVVTSTQEDKADARLAEPSEAWDGYRDGAGRLRFEPVSRPGLPGGTAAAIQIVDPQGGLTAFLTPPNIAMRVRFRPVAPGGYSIFGMPDVRLLLGEKGQRTVVTKKLGLRMIAGAEFQGELTTLTVEGDRTVVATGERWSSSQLGLVGLEIISEPGRRTTSTVQNLVRGEQPPALFMIPKITLFRTRLYRSHRSNWSRRKSPIGLLFFPLAA